MRFIFITKPFLIEPLGIMHLMSVIKGLGHNACIITSDHLKQVVDTKPEVVCYSVMTGDQTFYDEINKTLKSQFDFYSIAGGPHPTFFPEMLEQSSFDAICIGEGEKALEDFILRFGSTNVQNFWFKTSSGIIRNNVRPLVDLDDLPQPDRSVEIGSIKHFMASRGCPFNCSYCFNKSYRDIYGGIGIRYRSVDKVISEIREYPSRFVYFQDDIFGIKLDWLKEFALHYKQKINVPFHCHLKAELLNKERVDLLRSAGCYSVHLAAESGNAQIREKILNRRVSNEQIINAVKMSKDAGLKVMLQNIIGLPFTTLENDFETLELNIQCSPTYAWASIFQPYPKTELGLRCMQSGLYTGDFSDICGSFFEESVLNLPHKNKISVLQKLFAVSVRYPKLYYSGRLKKLLTRNPGDFVSLYKTFRRKCDKELYGFYL